MNNVKLTGVYLHTLNPADSYLFVQFLLRTAISMMSVPTTVKTAFPA